MDQIASKISHLASQLSDESPRIPPELFLPIFEALERRGLKRTILNLMLADKQSFELGLPYLLRRINLIHSSRAVVTSFAGLFISTRLRNVGRLVKSLALDPALIPLDLLRTMLNTCLSALETLVLNFHTGLRRCSS
jgi:hypothetical protein